MNKEKVNEVKMIIRRIALYVNDDVWEDIRTDLDRIEEIVEEDEQR